MAETTTIEWTRNDDGTPGRTWNPATGCTKISAGCDNCYAETIAERFRGHAAFPKGFDVQIRADKVNDPLKWRKPTRVFVNSMSDLFHDEINREWIAEIFAVMATARRHTFQLLTKRHGRMRSLLNDPNFVHKVRHRAQGKGLSIPDFTWPLPNLWLGVSVENQQWADIRIPALLDTPAAVRFLSCEPLLGPIDLKQAVITMGSERGHGLTASYVHAGGCCDLRLHGIDWVITGGESGRKARPAHPDWFRALRDQCATAGVAYFHKQNGEWTPQVPERGPDPKRDVAILNDGAVYNPGQLPPRTEWQHKGMVPMYRVGKKAAGRELDGRTHDEFPAQQ
jgi:protein gp37